MSFLRPLRSFIRVFQRLSERLSERSVRGVTSSIPDPRTVADISADIGIMESFLLDGTPEPLEAIAQPSVRRS